ncbi:hypothetical protein [Mycolicibacterium phlei]
MTLLHTRVRPGTGLRRVRVPRTRPPRWRAATLFAVLSGAYFLVGAVMVLRYNFFDPDGPSRVANAAFTFLSRDPHLSAVGFVWNPLPSLVTIPVLHLSPWWPALKTAGLAGVVQSAMFMAGAALMVGRIAVDHRVGTVWRWVAVCCFALNPVVITYGASGMSEAAELFCLLWCVRYLLLWVESGRIGDLAWAGVALGVGYLARYEVVFAAAGAAVLVAVVSLRRPADSDRLTAAILNTVIVLFPIATAFGVWAVTGWVVSGDLFATLSSQYGNVSQIATALSRGATTNDGNSAWWLIATRLFAMQPFVGLACVLAVAAAVLRKRPHAAVPLTTFGSVLAFAAWGQYSGTTFGWFRFYLPAVPMVIVIALLCCAPPRAVSSRRIEPALGSALLCASLVIGIPVTTVSMLNRDIGNQHLQFGLNSLIDPQAHPPDEQWYRRLRTDDRQIARYLDDMNLPDGSVLMDTFVGWGIWLASDHPRQLVITSDYDFRSALNRPWDVGVRYIIVSNPALNDAPDAINLRYPDLWATGAGFGTLVYRAAGATGQERWRIYEIRPPATAEDIAHIGGAGAPG